MQNLQSLKTILICKFDDRSIKADTFKITHLNSIELNAKLFRSSQLRHSLELNSQHIKGKLSKTYIEILSLNSNSLIINNAKNIIYK